MSGFTTRTRPEAVGTPVSVVVNEWLSGRERAGRVDEVETGDISFLAQDEHVVPLGPPRRPRCWRNRCSTRNLEAGTRAIEGSSPAKP